MVSLEYAFNSSQSDLWFYVLDKFEQILLHESVPGSGNSAGMLWSVLHHLLNFRSTETFLIHKRGVSKYKKN